MQSSNPFIGPWARVVILASVLLAGTPSPRWAQSVPPSVSSRVVDAVTGRPLAAVSVSAARAFTLTSPDGTFALQVPQAVTTLTVHRMGYAQASFPTDAVPEEIRLDPTPYLLESVAVEVEGRQALAAGTAMAAQTVRREALSLRAGTSLAELLAGSVRAEASRAGSWGSRAVIRGLTGERLSVLIDGNQVNRACTFGMDQGLSALDPATVERVEVLAGPGSALYGSGNVGGIVNVVTRRPGGGRGLSGEVRAGASSAVPGGTLGGHLSLVGDRLSASAAVDASDYGDYTTPAATVEGSSYRQLTGDAKVDFRPARAHHVSLKGQYYAGRDIGWPMMGGANIPEETRTAFSVDYGWQAGRGAVDAVTLRAFRQKLDHHMTVDAVMQGAMGPMLSKADATSYSTTSGVRGQLRLVPSSTVSADVGAEVTRWDAEGTRWSETSSGGMPAKSATFRTWPGVVLTDAGTFFQAQVVVTPHLTLSAGSRVDHVRRSADGVPSSSEDIFTGNAGLRATLGGGLAFRTSVGMGYRNPDPMELYGLALKPDGFVYRGRPDLETERSRNVEAALSWGGAGANVSVTGYRNRLEDMISLTLVPGETVAGRPVRQYTALGTAVLKGLSISGDADLPAGLRVEVTGNYTHAEDPATGSPVVGIPPATLHAAVRRAFDGGVLRWVEVAAEGADAQDRVVSMAGESATGGYAVTHLRLGVTLGDADVNAGVENVFDRAYRAHLDPAKLLRPGRNFFIRVSRAF